MGFFKELEDKAVEKPGDSTNVVKYGKHTSTTKGAPSRYESKPHKPEGINANCCIRCGNPAHRKGSRSPDISVMCNYCKKVGHFAKVCLKRKNVKKPVACVVESHNDIESEVISVIREDGEEETYITTSTFAVEGNLSDCRDPIVDIQVGGKDSLTVSRLWCSHYYDH